MNATSVHMVAVPAWLVIPVVLVLVLGGWKLVKVLWAMFG